MRERNPIKVEELTQRLDHMVPDTRLSAEENARFKNELERLSDLLFELLPDKSLSPMERLERLARAVEPREPRLDHLRPASKKVAELKDRLEELVPGDHAPEEKIARMVALLDELVSSDKKGASVIEKLEQLGDPRGKVEPE